MPVSSPPHNLLSAWHLDTLTASVARGSLIIGNSTPKWSALAVGANGTVLTSDGTDVSWQAPAGGGLTIGTTTITSGTSGRVLYNNAGVVGEMTTTGSGTELVLSTSPALLTTATLTRDSVGATSTDGLIIQNTTAAAAGAQQYSPRLRLTGQGWKTNATAASQTVDWVVENQPVQGAANPTTNLVFSSQVNGGGYTTRLFIGSNGLRLTDGSNRKSINAPQGLILQDFTDGGAAVYMFAVQATGASPAFYWESGGNTARMRSTNQIGWTASASDASAALDTILTRGGAAATVQHGADVNGAAVSQVLQAANGITGTDRTGGNFTLASGKGTGAGAVSQVFIQTPTVLGSGTTAQSLTTRVTIDSSGLKATGYLSSDGSAGVTAGPYTTITSITVKNGLITAISGS